MGRIRELDGKDIELAGGGNAEETCLLYLELK